MKITQKIFFTIIAINIVIASYGQNNTRDSIEFPTLKLKIRHLKGMKCMDGQYGWAKYGTFINLGYGQFLTDKTMLNVQLNYEYGIIGITKYDYKNFKIGIYQTAYKLNNIVFLNLGGGGLLGTIQSSNKDLNINDEKFNAGLFVGGNVEIYLFNKLSIVALAEQQYNFMDKFGSMHFHLGGGLRIYIY